MVWKSDNWSPSSYGSRAYATVTPRRQPATRRADHCVRCGIKLARNYQGCPQCGQEVAQVHQASQSHNCSSCGHEIEVDFKFCPYCRQPIIGQTLVESTTCQCGTVRESDHAFCGGCGQA